MNNKKSFKCPECSFEFSVSRYGERTPDEQVNLAICPCGAEMYEVEFNDEYFDIDEFARPIDHLLALGDMLFDGAERKGVTILRLASDIKDSLPKIVAYADDPEANEAAIDTLTELLKNQAKELSEFFDATPVVVPEQRDPMVDALFGRHREA